jgi:isopentenyl diphosphate isomerase/L-lactate dehydrogenase-like FMN-dependent dehydrogenase
MKGIEYARRKLNSRGCSGEVLEEIVEAVSASKVMVLADGGIRTGYDVLKMPARIILIICS